MRRVWVVVGAVLMGWGAARADEGPPGTGAGGPATATVQEASGLRVAGDGRIRFGALLQGWWVLDHQGASRNTFRLRRAEVALQGDVASGRVLFGVMVDPAKVLEPASVRAVDAAGKEVSATRASSALSALKDFYVGVSTPVADVSIGQFKIPISYEGFHSSGELLFAERALLSRGLGTLPFAGTTYQSAADSLGLASGGYGDKRDLGVKAEKRIGPVYWYLGLFNGSGSNHLDTDSRKDLAARVEVFPVAGLMLGVAGYVTLRDGMGAAPGAKDRAEADVRFEAGPVVVQAEYLFARDHNQKTGAMTPSQGTYLAVAARLPHGFEVAGRFGWWDLDMDADRSQVWEAAGGLHYHLKGFNASLKLDYGFYRPTLPGLQDTHEVILAAQVKF